MKIQTRNKFSSCVFSCFLLLIGISEGIPEVLPEIIRTSDIHCRAPNTRKFQGIPGLAISHGGRLWATWYAGPTPGEDENNYVVLATSGDDGHSWNELLIIDPDGFGPLRAFDPTVWLDPLGRLWVFWAQTLGHQGENSGVWAIMTETPDEADPRWTAPRRLTDGVMMNKPTVLSCGTWLLPASTWRTTDYSARAVASKDNGRTFAVLGGCNIPVDERSYDEHMFIERRDNSLWMLVRTRYGIGESVSMDNGFTWSELTRSNIQHPSARFYIRRLKSENLLLIKHGPLGKRSGRSHLTAFISRNDGKSWCGGLLLDERVHVSYPDGQQATDGTIYIAYDYWRKGQQEILMAVFTEADVLVGSPVSDKARLKLLINKPLGTKPYKIENRLNNHGSLSRHRELSGRLDFADSKTQQWLIGSKLFSDRDYILAECPEALKGACFIPIPMDDIKVLRCVRSGVVGFLTPTFERNRNSQEATLLDQGFECTALAEFCLFDPSTVSNYCMLFQKDCGEDEIITVGKWAIPVFAP